MNQSTATIDGFYTLPLTTQMRVAANVLAKATERQHSSLDWPAPSDREQSDRKWSASALRTKANQWDREDQIAAEEKAKRAAKTAADLQQLVADLDQSTKLPALGSRVAMIQQTAEKLVALGWTKAA